MPKLLFIIALVAIATGANGQTAISKNTAAVNVIVTDTKKVPVSGEEVVFTSSENKSYKCRTGVDGKTTIRLTPGFIYTIKIKTITDSTAYGSLEIPALQPNQFFTSPFSVVIEFEPPKNFTLNNVEFDSGKPTLRVSSFKELDEIAEYMKWKADESYEISGHTDNVGKDEDNQKLSQQRAEAVKNYLVKKGIKATRITAKGYGATKPVADNETPEGRQQNRRTELLIK
jgi:OOP family OmpA-OmpF porin